jgi:hypothetical protein
MTIAKPYAPPSRSSRRDHFERGFIVAGEIANSQNWAGTYWLRPLAWRPRFSTRVLLIATGLLSVTLWLHLDWIDRRRAAIADGDVTPLQLLDLNDLAPHAPWLLGWFGEEGQSILIVHNCGVAEWERRQSRLARLFPEAEIRRDVPDQIFDDPSTDATFRR